MWHTETDIFALILFFIMLYKNLLAYHKEDYQQKILIYILGVSIVCCLIDYISSTLMNLNNHWFWYNFFLILYYASIPTVNGMWLIYLFCLIYPVGSKEQKSWVFLSELPIVLYMLTALLNPLTGAFFTLSKDMVYTRGPLFQPLAVWFYTLYAFYGLIFVFIKWKKIEHGYDRIFLMIFFLASIFIPAVQVMHPGWLIAEITYAVLFVLYDSTVERQRREHLMHQIQEQNVSLQEAVKNANAANVAKSEFLSRMSHDIRTPINGILGMTYLAKEVDNPPLTAQYLDKIDTSSKFLLGLVNDVLDMSHMENSEIELKTEPYPINELNEYIDSVIRPLCLEKKQKLIIDENFVEKDVLPIADKLRCNQIIFNLLSNAVKYTPEGGTITYKITDDILPGNRMEITHEVKDTGIGMSETFQKVLFDPFSQESRDDSTRAYGTGLGLAIVKKLVDRMGGTIQVSSTLGKGSDFIVKLNFDTIPVEEYQKNLKGRENKEERDAFLAGKHILVCEDHPMNQEIVKTLLEEKKCVVSLAEDGQKGVALFKKSNLNYFDAVLMDIHMPHMDGLDATREIRQLDRTDAKKVPIIAMTADAFLEDVKKSFAAGMNEHITKPLDPEVLYEVLHDVMQCSQYEI